MPALELRAAQASRWPAVAVLSVFASGVCQGHRCSKEATGVPAPRCLVSATPSTVPSHERDTGRVRGDSGSTYEEAASRGPLSGAERAGSFRPLMNHARAAATGQRPDLLDPSTLSQLGGIEFIAREVVEGFLMGLHRSPHRGFSAEFAELRAYQAGDDLRYIDWRMFGRSDRYYVKQFEEETNLRAHLLIDVSESMGWSSDPGVLPPKIWYAKHLAACMALILLRQGDSVGMAAFHDRIVERVRARGGRRQWTELTRRLAALQASGGTSAESALRDLAVRLRRRGLVILLSDLLVKPDETLTALKFLRHHGHEVLVFHLLDPGERELPAAAEARFFDPETDDELLVSVADIRAEYREAVAAALDEWYRKLRPHGIDYQIIDTDQPLSTALRAYLRKRERLG